MSDEANIGVNGKKFTRGISYPVMTLEQAIEKARAFHREERKSAAPVVSAIRHFGYSETSSGGRQTVATLIQFGLMEDEGRKENRHVRLTDRALTLLLAEPASEEFSEALRAAAYSPRIYEHLLGKWSVDLPSDTTMAYYLQKEFDFNPKTLHSFIEDFRATIAFARLNDVSVKPSIQVDRSALSNENSNGDSEKKEGTRMELAVVDQGAQDVASRSQSRQPLALLEHVPGEREWLRGPLSKLVTYRLFVSGDLGSRELGKLIKLLEAQKLVLDDDDE